MNNGWIKLYRKILDNPKMMDDNDYFIVWIKLLLLVTHQEKRVIWKGHEINLKPGQILTGRKFIASQSLVSEMKVERILKWLESEQQIEQQTSNKNRIITILNWNRYQQSEQQIEHPVNNHRTTTEQQVNTYKNDKNVKNDKNIDKSIVRTDKRNPEIEDCRNYFLQVMKIPTEDGSATWNRRYWMHLIKEGDRGVNGVKALIDIAHEDDFFKNNMTSAKNLYNNRIKIIARKRGNIPKVAVMPKEVI